MSAKITWRVLAVVREGQNHYVGDGGFRDWREAYQECQSRNNHVMGDSDVLVYVPVDPLGYQRRNKQEQEDESEATA